MIKNPEIHDAYVKLEMEDEFLGALERVIRDLYCESRISSPYPIDFVPDIKVINSYLGAASGRNRNTKASIFT